MTPERAKEIAVSAWTQETTKQIQFEPALAVEVAKLIEAECNNPINALTALQTKLKDFPDIAEQYKSILIKCMTDFGVSERLAREIADKYYRVMYGVSP